MTICVAVEVLGVSTRVGHRRCAYTFLHVGTHKVIAWALCSYIRSDCGNFVLSVCDVNGRKHTTGFVIVPVKFYVLVKWNKLYDHKKLWC